MHASLLRAAPKGFASHEFMESSADVMVAVGALVRRVRVHLILVDRMWRGPLAGSLDEVVPRFGSAGRRLEHGFPSSIGTDLVRKPLAQRVRAGRTPLRVERGVASIRTPLSLTDGWGPSASHTSGNWYGSLWGGSHVRTIFALSLSKFVETESRGRRTPFRQKSRSHATSRSVYTLIL